ncbi:MAG: nucleotidyltransferase domain-containing protein [Spirochaetota bacterium]
MENIKNDLLNQIQSKVKNHFQDNFLAFILYGSYARGEAKENADIDILLIFNKVNLSLIKETNDLLLNQSTDFVIDKLYCKYQDFLLETHPVYTTIKKTGIVLYGKPDMSPRRESEEVKYKRYFQRSKEWETRKLQNAEAMYERNPRCLAIDSLYVAAKHAIQARLSIEGKGFHNQFEKLYDLAKKTIGSEIADNFVTLKGFYDKELTLDRDDFQKALVATKKVMLVYND